MVLLTVQEGTDYYHRVFRFSRGILYSSAKGESMKKTLIMSLIAVSTVFYAHAGFHNIEQKAKNKAKDFIFSNLDQTCLKIDLGDTIYFCPPVTKSKITQAVDKI